MTRNREISHEHIEFLNRKHSSVMERCFGLLKLQRQLLKACLSNQDAKPNRYSVVFCTILFKGMPVGPLEMSWMHDLGLHEELHRDPITHMEPSNQWSIWRETVTLQMFSERRATGRRGNRTCFSYHRCGGFWSPLLQ